MSEIKNYIYVKERALTLNQCNSIIEYIDSSRKSFANFYFLVNDSVSTTPHKFLIETIQHNINQYIEEHKFLKTLYAPWGIYEHFNLQKYLPGQAYHPEHMEHGKDDYDSTRLLAWMIYLNDVEVGGETYWPQQNFKKSARVGDLCIWPAGWTHSHYGIVSKEQIKYVITGWCSFL